MKVIISVPHVGLRRLALSAADVYEIMTDYIETGYVLSEIVFEDMTAEPIISTFVSDLDGVRVVQIDTTGQQRIRVNINDGPIYDGNPETDEAPGAHYIKGV